MKIEKFSASAMEAAELCLARWDADNKAARIGSMSNHAAMVGSACHGGMEYFVRTAVMSNIEPRTLKTLEFYYTASYAQVFGNIDTDSSAFKEGWALLVRWFKRTTWDGFTVLSVEEKKNFPVPTGEVDPATGEPIKIPFNFIFDRLDQISETEYRVVDYKSLSQPVSPMDLHDKIQPRAYGLAAWLMFPHAERIWVGFDMIRWEGSVETVYTRDDNIETWNRIKRAVRKIVECDPDEIDPKTGEPKGVPETLNTSCNFCIKVSTCGAVAANVAAAGVYSYPDLESMVDARALYYMQAKAAENAYKELDTAILRRMDQENRLEVKTDFTIAEAKVRGTRSINPEHVRREAGQALFEKYGSNSITLKDLDALLSDPELPEGARARIESSITRTLGNPYVSTKENRK